MTRYDPATIEPKWQAYWDEDDTFRTPEGTDRPKTYILDMFPYPSGSGLHVGHPEGYTATDIVARYRRAAGFDVLHPMGWDAFGLPAEQHAIVTGTHPRDTTARNISTFKRQLKMLGFSYDWAREIDTTSPEYVKWTQWIFLKLFKRGLAYQSEVAVNWCGELGTVLANEEVINGLSERGGHPVERMPLRQWVLKITAYADRVLKITAYADRLLEDLGEVEWPNSTRIMQQEWIGRSEGAEVNFDVVGHDAVIEVFTTRPDTLFGATFMVLAPEHPLVQVLTTDERRDEVAAYVEQAKNKSERDRQANKDKTGVFTGGLAINPVNGAEVPIYIGGACARRARLRVRDDARHSDHRGRQSDGGSGRCSFEDGDDRAGRRCKLWQVRRSADGRVQEPRHGRSRGGRQGDLSRRIQAPRLGIL